MEAPTDTSGSGPTPRWTERPRILANRASDLLSRDIWELEHLGRRTARARLYLLLRVLTLTFQGLKRNKIPVQAAALTFYSLIGIGPLIAFGIMISGFALERGDEGLVTEKVYEAIAFAAPQVALDGELAPGMRDMIDNFTSAAKSGTVGLVGALMLAFIALQVLSSIEGSFNSLWGVERGRKWSERIVVYWTFVSLGAVLGTTALTLVTVSTISRFVEQLPFGGAILDVVLFLSPAVAFVMFTVLLAVFFRFIPNCKVEWKPAFTGALLVVILLHLYNMLSFLYVQRVVDTKSLYGSVGILVVLMLGLYIFWLLILLGGQVTYAVQNADFLTNESAWQRTSQRTRELVSLGSLLMVVRRFDNAEAPIRLSELHKALRVPSHILNTSIARLCDIGYLNPVVTGTAEDERDRAYQPGRALDDLTLGEFKRDFERFGNNEGGDLIAESSPGLRAYVDGVLGLAGCAEADTRLRDLL